jgi:endonuclease/exonuclease/phosphatase (EEP) superfamily protein YafD
LIEADSWWIRLFDYTRLHSLFLIALVAMGCLVCIRRRRAALLVMLGVAAAVQCWRIYPYFGFAPTEMAMAAATSPGTSCLTVLGLNVLQRNHDHEPTLRLIERVKPDILFLMETDAGWAAALAPALKSYPHRLLRPLDNTYGLIFASRLPVKWALTKDTTEQNTPTVYGRLATRDGKEFNFIGLHPRPPLPGQNTTLRDRKIGLAAKTVDSEGLPVLAMGDFNDVPWSRTTQTFKLTGGFRDPRIGRGNYATFPSDYVAVGWPLDQLFLTPEFTFRSLRIGASVGSDHRPLVAQVCLAPPIYRADRAPDEGPVDDRE